MDSRLKAAPIVAKARWLRTGVFIGGISLLLPALAAAQGTVYPDYRDDEAPQVERNQELPKGLTLVPWKIERRTSLSEIRDGKPAAAKPRPATPGQTP